MAGERTLKVTILGDSKDAEKAFDRLDTASGRVHSTLKNVGIALAGAFTVTAGVSLVKGFLGEAEEARKVGAQTDAVIKSTGGAAKVTADQIGDLATALSNKTGVDDEAIQTGQNLLLTFTDVQNRVGKGNDIFNQATDVMTDMSAALGQDMPASAMQLGKALNDPIRGVTALRRVGVTFTKQQEEQIKKMQESGDVAGAQKVILAELRKEFGGSAEAQATAGQKLSVIWGNIQEQLGTALLPLFDKVASWLGNVLPRAVAVATGAISKVVDWVKEFSYSLTTGFTEDEGTPIERFALMLRDTFLPVIQKVIGWVKSFAYTMKTGFSEQDTLTGPEKFAFFVRDTLIPVLKNVAEFIGNNLKPILIGLGAVVLALVSPWALVVAALVAAYLKFSWFRTGVQAVVDFFTNVVGPAIGAVVSYIGTQIGHLADWWRKNWDDIRDAVKNVVTVIAAIVKGAVEVLVFIWKNAGEHILDVVKIAWDQIRLVIDTVVRVIRDIITVFIAVFSGDWGKAWDAIADIPRAAFDLIVGTVKSYLEAIWHAVQGGLDLVRAVWDAGFEGIKGIVKGAVRIVVDTFLGLVQTFVDAGARAFGWIPGIGGKLRDAAADFAAFRDDVNRALGGINDKVINVSIRGIERHIDPNIGGSFDDGGVVPGPVGRPMVAVVHGGEEVLTPRQRRSRSAAAGVIGQVTFHTTVNGKPDQATWDELDRRERRLLDGLARAVATA